LGVNESRLKSAPCSDVGGDVASGDLLCALADVLEQRRMADPEHSYVAGLHARGLDAILRKLGEESLELVLAAKGGDPEQVIYEAADLWFHTLVLLTRFDLRPEQVIDELARRFGLSGLEEKAARKG